MKKQKFQQKFNGKPNQRQGKGRKPMAGNKNNHRNQNIELNKLILHRFDIIIESSVLVAHIRNRKQQRETRENRQSKYLFNRDLYYFHFYCFVDFKTENRRTFNS